MSRSTKSKKKHDQSAKRRGWPIWSSSKQSTESLDTESLETNPLPGSEPLIMLSSTDDLYLDKFCKCIDGDLSVLIVSGVPTADQLTDAWISIMSQYQVLIKSQESKQSVELSAKLEAYNGKIVHVEGLIAALLLIGYNEELVECLRLWDYDLDFEPETLERDLKRVRNMLGNDKTQLAMARAEFEEMQAEKGETEELEGNTKTKFNKILLQMFHHFKPFSMFKPETTTVTNFAQMYADLAEYSRQLKIPQNGTE